MRAPVAPWHSLVRCVRRSGLGLLWLIVACVSVQVWGLQHDIRHARQLDAPQFHDAAAVPPVTPPTGQASKSLRVAKVDFGAHHHCHLFDGATLAAALAAALPQWADTRTTAPPPVWATGRSHAQANALPFHSRAPPASV